MFNNTLSAYSKRTSSTSLDLDNITISTMNKWFKRNWYWKWTEYDKHNPRPDLKGLNGKNKMVKNEVPL